MSNMSRLVHATDWYPTLVRAAGGTPPLGLDGVDQWGALLGSKGPPRTQMMYHVLNTFGLATAMR